MILYCIFFFFFKQKTAYEMRISDWSSDVCSSDLSIGANVVFGLAAFSSITALPVILSVSLFIAVLTTVTRNFRESEMVVWFASGLSLKDWIGQVLRCAVRQEERRVGDECAIKCRSRGSRKH